MRCRLKKEILKTIDYIIVQSKGTSHAIPEPFNYANSEVYFLSSKT